MAKLKPAEGYETVPFHFEDGAGAARSRLPLGLGGDEQLRCRASYAHTDYDFEKPSLSLMAQSEAEPVADSASGARSTASPARISTLDRGDDAGGDPARGAAGAARAHPRRPAPCAASPPGCTLQARRLSARRPERRVPGAQRRLPRRRSRATAAGIDADGETYQVELGRGADRAALPAAAHRRRDPVMRGPQTATVVGPSGEEIFTDKYARVKVQFHWDRLGKKDENSSCFVRVSHDLGRRGLGLHPDPAHRPGGDRRLHRGRPGPADHHRPGLQRRRDAALRPAGQRHAVGLEVELLARAAAATTS